MTNEIVFDKNLSIGAMAVCYTMVTLIRDKEYDIVSRLYTLSSDKKEITDKYIDELLEKKYIKLIEDNGKYYYIIGEKGEALYDSLQGK